MTISLNQVRSYEYMIGGNVSQAGYQQSIASSAVDMVIAGDGKGSLNLNRSVADPTNSKLIIGYINTAESYANADPNLFSGSSLPSWFGNPNPAYNGIYTVQYWNPAWEQQIFTKIDALAKAGYNGVFLDVLSADSQWSAGNPENNPIYAGATAAMSKLLADINAHVDSLNLDHPFYLIGNQPTNLAVKDPGALKNLDAVFNEVLNWSSSPTNGFAVSNVGNTVSDFVSSTLTPVYTAAGLKVFGNDYAPLTNLDAQFQSFEYYTERGWTPSVQSITPTSAIMTKGPFMFMATPDASTVQGTANYVNFISGGLTTSATLIGGDKGDFFIGGPGQNIIKAGAGNDMIYAHPESAGSKSVLQLQLIGSDVGSAPLPKVTVKINGQVAANAVTVNKLYSNGTTTQELDINTKAFGVIKSIEIDGVGIKWTDANNYNALFLNGASFNGQTIDLSKSTLNSTAQLTNGGRQILLNHDATVNLAVPATAPAVNTSDVIDGGGGINTVVYRGNYSEYSFAKNADGTLTVTALDTAEGPDTLKNVQYLQFSDQKVATTAFGIAAPTQSAATSAAPTAPTAPSSIGAAAPVSTGPHAPTALADASVANGYVNAAHNTATQALTGSADAGAKIAVFDGTKQLGTATTDSTGHWSYTLGKLADGAHSLTATATVGTTTTAASGPLNFTVDTKAPTAEVGNVLFNSTTGQTTITGHAEAGSTVSVFVDVPYGTVGKALGSAVADASGNWSFTGAVSTQGYHGITETVVDQAGNTGASTGAAMWGKTGGFAITSGGGDDVMIGQAGDTLAGGAGSDTFVFNQNFGKEVVKDFDSRSEQIAFDHHMFTSFSDVMAHAYQSGTSTVIYHDAANVITLQNVSLSSLNAGDFLFV